ncbi:hypothetical protein D9C73_005345 [Collichthys lucidus]|uniref:Uncharacterized protein n=1 Tax=Collichthys lucidus TaxID=240159 RepID=A0A4U5UDB9_COLLU|nr:hypothetical protein D9C73_005345 [Collichthys lucidus]
MYCWKFLYWNFRDLNREGHYANKRHASLPVEVSEIPLNLIAPACRRSYPCRKWKSASFGLPPTAAHKLDYFMSGERLSGRLRKRVTVLCTLLQLCRSLGAACLRNAAHTDVFAKEHEVHINYNCPGSCAVDDVWVKLELTIGVTSAFPNVCCQGYTSVFRMSFIGEAHETADLQASVPPPQNTTVNEELAATD